MKQTYIQPAMLIIELEASEVIAYTGKGQADVQMRGTTYEFDAPRTRLWGGDED